MSTLDQRFTAAADDLRRELGGLEPPPFRPSRSPIPVMLIAAMLVGIGIVGYIARSPTDEPGDISVVTQPEVPDNTTPDNITPDVPRVAPSPVDSEAGEATPTSRWVTVTEPAPGEFFVPLAAGWSPSEARLIVYRTGAADQAHLVIDTFDVEAPPIELPFTPADIEQIYWHPLVGDQLLYAANADLMTFDLTTLQTEVAHHFDDCDTVDSGTLPVAPSLTGAISLLCHAPDGVTQVVYDLATGVEQRAATISTTAAFLSPSGDIVVRLNDDGSASVLDRSLTDTGRTLDLQGNLFGFVVDDQGLEWVVTTLFNGPIVGSVVLLPADGAGAGVVLIGPDRGDPYPPEGTQISAAGDKVVISIEGEDDGLAGRITFLDLGTSFTDPARYSIAHQSEGLYDYWSNPFIAVSPSGVIGYSSDRGRDTVTTIVGNFIDEAGAHD